MIRPMPSPNGTNHEKLFILQGRRPSPRLAYDSKFPVAGRHALDDPSSPSGAEIGRSSGNAKDAIKQIVRWACENLNDEETYELSMLLQKSIAETPLGGQGDPGVASAMDAASIRKWRAYGESFVRKAGQTARPATDPTASVGSEEEQYHARFPHARRLNTRSL